MQMRGGESGREEEEKSNVREEKKLKTIFQLWLFRKDASFIKKYNRFWFRNGTSYITILLWPHKAYESNQHSSCILYKNEH